MEKLTAEQIQKEVEEHREEWIKERDEICPEHAADDEVATQVYLYAHWIDLRLMNAGVSLDLREVVSNELGRTMANGYMISGVNSFPVITALYWRLFIEELSKIFNNEIMN